MAHEIFQPRQALHMLPVSFCAISGIIEMQVFETIVEQEGKFVFVSLPFAPKSIWGAQPRFNVVGYINDFPVQGCLGALGTKYFLRLSAKWLKQASLDIGSQVTVKLSLINGS
ncbi:MAG TPA: DUF1905 domain-containing protein [Thermoflexales bacterium]|nr:DUF1905 domain-containing protein [Thermoflexales bacterium]